ncbi:MAG TPA: glycosyltransferase [Saliniramus sp.]|nr:glycosyltransferase [Saliniramus sp.]
MTNVGPLAPVLARPTSSMLMSTYARETAENLEACLASIRSQTVVPDQLVLVVDGPVGADQEAVLARFAQDPGEIQLTVLRLPENVGLAAAMNAGLALCTGMYTMRMDSDDLCEPDRVEKQLAYAAAHPEIDVVSSWSAEFFDDGSPGMIKASPVSHDSILAALRWRNVLVHPTICVRTATLRGIGGYRSCFGLLEDYDLYVRLAQAGAQFHVIPKVLLRMRVSHDQRVRRGGAKYALHEFRFRVEHYRTGFIGLREFILVTSLYSVFRLVSGRLRGRLYSLART